MCCNNCNQGHLTSHLHWNDLRFVTEPRTNDDVLNPSTKANITNDPEQVLLKIKELFNS